MNRDDSFSDTIKNLDNVLKDTNKPKPQSVEEAAEIHARPNYENDESTWGAIASSSFKIGATWREEHFDRALQQCLNSKRDLEAQLAEMSKRLKRYEKYIESRECGCVPPIICYRCETLHKPLPKGWAGG